MAYRTLKKPKRQRRVMQATATENMVFVKNGATANLAIPCWYHEVKHPQHTHVHDREWHDHRGWPNPDHPDRSCQDAYHIKHPPFKYDCERKGWHHAGRYLDLSKCFPIHLTEEGYEDVSIFFEPFVPGLKAVGKIDPEEDHVVRVVFDAAVDDARSCDVDTEFTVLVSRGEFRDVVSTGKLRILAGPIERIR